MTRRCNDPKDCAYARYGGAGVKVCPEWETFAGFLASMGERPAGTTLGRVLDMGDYTRSNCVWMTPEEQRLHQRNKRALLKFVYVVDVNDVDRGQPVAA
jgi:hypothetical protein